MKKKKNNTMELSKNSITDQIWSHSCQLTMPNT